METSTLAAFFALASLSSLKKIDVIFEGLHDQYISNWGIGPFISTLRNLTTRIGRANVGVYLRRRSGRGGRSLVKDSSGAFCHAPEQLLDVSPVWCDEERADGIIWAFLWDLSNDLGKSGENPFSLRIRFGKIQYSRSVGKVVQNHTWESDNFFFNG